MKIMVWPAARGGMRSVVEGYGADGFLSAQQIESVVTYTEGSFAYRQWIFARAIARFCRLLLRGDIELVHVHAAMKGSFWRKSILASLARRRGLPVVLHLHGSEMRPFYDSQPPWRRRIIAAQLARAASVIVLSESWRRFVHEIAPTARTAIVPNYVAVPRQPAIGTGSPLTLLFLGAVGTRKGIYDLLTALTVVRAAHPDTVLLVGGNGEVEAASARAAQLGLGGAARFLGWVGPEVKGDLLRRADIYVLPSHNENLPVSVIEAMAHGLPVVSTTVGGIPELMTDGKHGRLVPPGDPQALAAALLALIRDPGQRRAMGAAGRRRVEEAFSRETVLPRLAELYQATALARTRPAAQDPRH